MNNRTTIINELQTVAPGLMQLPLAMPYKVPQDYFDSLSDTLLSTIKNEDRPLQFLAGAKRMPYLVPQSYFENLATDILQKVNTKPAVPEGYFDTLPLILLNKVRRQEVAQELETIAPLLNTISKQPVQAVPEGYFEQLQPFAGRITQQQPLVVSIKKRTGWFKYAAAASVALLLSFGAYQYFYKTPPVGEEFTKLQNVNVDKQLAQLDDATIENYLQENESVTETNAGLYKNMQETEIEDLLQDFTEQELQQQLLDNPAPVTTTKSKKT